jgi:hypothetical protein
MQGRAQRVRRRKRAWKLTTVILTAIATTLNRFNCFTSNDSDFDSDSDGSESVLLALVQNMN